jgi:hypothetical protein
MLVLPPALSPQGVCGSATALLVPEEEELQEPLVTAGQENMSVAPELARHSVVSHHWVQNHCLSSTKY